MILLEPANKITHANVGDQAADHLSNPVFRELRLAARLGLGPLASGGLVNARAFLRTNIPKLAQ